MVVDSYDKSKMKQYEKSIYSQNGEDGIIEYIFNVITPTNKVAVEFGAGDGINLSNTKLLLSKGWRVNFIECDSKKFSELLSNYAGNEKVAFSDCRVTAENVNQLFSENKGFPEDFDLLSIDIDSQDYKVWEAIKVKPKVVIIEFNP